MRETVFFFFKECIHAFVHSLSQWVIALELIAVLCGAETSSADEASFFLPILCQTWREGRGHWWGQGQWAGWEGDYTTTNQVIEKEEIFIAFSVSRYLSLMNNLWSVDRKKFQKKESPWKLWRKWRFSEIEEQFKCVDCGRESKKSDPSKHKASLWSLPKLI